MRCPDWRELGLPLVAGCCPFSSTGRNKGGGGLCACKHTAALVMCFHMHMPTIGLKAGRRHEKLGGKRLAGKG